MTPILNAMTVIGVVSIPGLMTGQLLAGEIPIEAGRKQIMLLYAIACAIMISVLWVLYLCASKIIGSDQYLNLELVEIKKK